MECVLEQTIE